MLVNNERASAFGAGWTLDGLERLHAQLDGDVVLTRGDGAILRFAPQGAGSGVFNPPSDLSPVDDPRAFVIDDLDNDGKLDILVPENDTGNAVLFLGDGLGGFASGQTIVTGQSAAANLFSAASGDFNGDGLADFALGFFSGLIQVHLGTGGGAFAAPIGLATGAAIATIAVGDFNNDGFADIMASHPGPNRLHIIPGDGSGGFGAAFELGIGTPRALQVADFNADGLDDVLVGRPRSNVMDFRLQNLSPPGSFTVVLEAAGASGGPDVQGTWTQDTADFDGDGDTDAAVADASNATVSRMRNANGLGTDWQSSTFPTLAVARSVAAGDFDGDGFADIASGNFVSSGGVSVLAGDGTGQFAAPVNIDTGTGSVTQLRAADLNGDGRMDLVLAAASQNRIAVLIGNTGQFGPLASPPGEFSSLVRNTDGSFTRTLKNGTEIEYDADGFMTARVRTPWNSEGPSCSISIPTPRDAGDSVWCFGSPGSMTSP